MKSNFFIKALSQSLLNVVIPAQIIPASVLSVCFKYFQNREENRNDFHRCCSIHVIDFPRCYLSVMIQISNLVLKRMRADFILNSNPQSKWKSGTVENDVCVVI